jgi:membrane associated rhomboid family serine protease
MGFNDRDYSRDDQTGYRLRAPSSAVGILLVVNLALFIVDAFVDGRLSSRMALRADLFSRPWQCWQLLTYGFLHDPNTVFHLLGNMLMLWMFGSDLEAIYGKREFLRIYFAAQVVGGLAWVAATRLMTGGDESVSYSVIGASGAVSGILMLFVFHYPRRILLFWGVVPVPVWLFGLFWLLTDISGFGRSMHGGGSDNVAYAAHLGGALLSALYYRFSWNFGRWLPESVTLPKLGGPGGFGRKPKLRVHQPPAEEAPKSMEAEVDRLLAKITDTGYDSLNEEEKRTLEKASSRYQRRRK